MEATLEEIKAVQAYFDARGYTLSEEAASRQYHILAKIRSGQIVYKNPLTGAPVPEVVVDDRYVNIGE